MALSPQEAEERARQAALANSSGVRTFPVGGPGEPPPPGARPGPGLQVELIEAPGMEAPPPTTQPPTAGATPAPTATDGTAGGASFDPMQDRGTPEQQIDRMGPGEVEQAIESSAAHVANMQTGEGALDDPDLERARVTGRKDQINQTLAAQGANPQASLEQLRDRRLAEYDRMHKEGLIDKTQHTKLRDRWKNIFNIIPREDFGLVLMDFGFRAMMAGETMGSAAALGAAGMGALGGIQQRRQQEYERQVGAFEAADEAARADLAMMQTPPETMDTEEGVMYWDTESQSWKPLMDPETGRRAMPSTLAGRPSVRQWEIQQWQEAFPEMSVQEATRRAMSGVTPEQARMQAEASFDRAFNEGVIFIPGKGRVRARDITDADREAYIRQRVRGYGYGGGGALNGGRGGGGQQQQPLTEKPEWMSDEEWADYQRLEQQYGTGAGQ